LQPYLNLGISLLLFIKWSTIFCVQVNILKEKKEKKTKLGHDFVKKGKEII